MEMFKSRSDLPQVHYEGRIEQFQTKAHKDGGTIGRILLSVHSRNPMVDFGDLLKLQLVYVDVRIGGSLVSVKDDE